MITLGLIGKNIKHSKSSEIYEALLNKKVKYTIYDYPTTLEIPTLDKIFKENLGLSITSPYKRFFLDQVEIVGPDLNAINCIKKSGETYLATNTDYFALSDMIDDFSKEFKELYFVILGDGVMSQVTSKLLENKQISFKSLSRKTTPNFKNLDIPEEIGAVEGQVIVVNSCSRDFSFNGRLSKDYLFWDYNYNFLPHQRSIPTKVLRYIDGLSLLKLQAKYAIKFWDI
ncbi:MAG: hypothetical protein DRQ88_10010 [Epsilonproteobacteria bacterium]|nr:MAG: hypothetical protein DRQ88_10010 [Campylobacterota bacterium]RLA65206.1 MAG: hypothetical protein DRQ89_01645 [Campylobacterota bacterium]